MANVPLDQLTDTWTSGATSYGVKLNVVDTSSAAASNLIDLQIGGLSKFSVRKDGFVTSANGSAFDSRAAAAAATIPAVVQSFRTAGYSAAGDGGHGFYKRRGSAPTLTTNKGFIQSADGAWWELVPQGGEVFIEQFGGKADWNGSTGTDNLQPLYDAMAIVARTINSLLEFGPRIRFGLGRYRFSGTIDPTRTVHIIGAGPVMNAEFGGGTEFNFPANTLGVQINGSDTIGTSGQLPGGSQRGSASNSIFEKISFYSSTPGLMGLSSTAHGFRMRTVASLRDCHFHNFPGDAIHIRGSVGASGDDYGNANDWRVDDCVIHVAGRHGLYVEGFDVNAGSCNNLVTHGIREEWGGCAICCINGIGNCAFNNSQITGYGNKSIYHLGGIYILIDHTPGIGGATTPGTNNNIWYRIGSDAAPISSIYPQWVSGGTGAFYILSRPIYTNGPGNQFLNTYTEGSGLCHIPGGMAIGINAPLTRASFDLVSASGGSFKPMLLSQKGIGTTVGFVTGDAGYAYNGERAWVATGTATSSSGSSDYGLGFIEWRRLRDGDTSGYWGFNGEVGPDIYFRPISREPNRNLFVVTTPSTVDKFGCVGPTKVGALKYDHISFGQYFNNSGTERLISGSEGAPTRAQEHARGEYRFEVNPSAGGHTAWSCTTAGPVNGETAWVSGTNYDRDVGGSFVKVDGARYYEITVDPGSAASTVKPVHTTPGQEVIGADGYGWTYIGPNAAVWSRAGFTVWDKSVTYDPPSLATAAVSPIQTLSHSGVAQGDFVMASFSNDLQGLMLNAWCVGDNVKFQFFNPTAGTVDLGSGTIKVRVQKQ